MKRDILILVAVITLFWWSPVPDAKAVLIGGPDGNLYEPVDDVVTWAVAQADAESKGGNLVEIGDAAENAIVLDIAMTYIESNEPIPEPFRSI